MRRTLGEDVDIGLMTDQQACRAHGKATPASWNRATEPRV